MAPKFHGKSTLALALVRAGTKLLFRKTSSLARSTPVYRLGVARDLDRIEEVVTTIVGWHWPALEEAALESAAP